MRARMLTLWRADYNTSRPHSQLGWSTPAEYAAVFTLRLDNAGI